MRAARAVEQLAAEAAASGANVLWVRQLWLETAQLFDRDPNWLPPPELLERLLSTGVNAALATQARAAAVRCASGSANAELRRAYRQALLCAAHAVLDALNDPSLAAFSVPMLISAAVSQSAPMHQLARFPLAPATSSSRQGKVEPPQKRRKKDPDAPKAPMSSYMFFSNAVRAAVKAELPGASLGEVGRELGERWRNLGTAERAAWTSRAALDKLRYDDEMDAFRGTDARPRVCTELTVTAHGGVTLALIVGHPMDRSRRWRQPGSDMSLMGEDDDLSCMTDSVTAGGMARPRPPPPGERKCPACAGLHRAHTCQRRKRP